MENSKPDANAPFIVLGMHKSGTTLVAEMLHGSGIQMIEGESDAGYNDGNKMEHDECRALNKDLLKCADQHSVETLAMLDLQTVNSEQWNAGRNILARYTANDQPWGFKDPRTLLTLAYWQEVAPDNHLIGVFRDPVEVFQHYAKKPWPTRFRDNRYYPVMALRAWCVYNKLLLENAKAQKGMLLLDYGSLMSSDEGLAQLSEFIGHQVEDARKSDMRRSSTERTNAYRIVRLWVLLRYGMDADRIFSELQRIKTTAT